MTGPVFASGRDLRTLAGIVSADRGEPPAEGVAPSLLSDLLGLVRCEHLFFGGFDTDRQLTWFGQFEPTEAGGGEPDMAAFWKHYWGSACSYPDRTGDLRSVIQVPAGGEQADRRVARALGQAAGRSVIAVIRDAHRDPGAQAVITRLLAARPDTIVVEMGLPLWRPPARAYLATYGASRTSGQAAAEMLGLTAPDPA